MKAWRGALLVAAAAVVRFVASAPGNIDDAFILLVYVRRVVAGQSLHYNAGEAPVDGFTSPLDLLLKSGVVALAPGDPILDLWIVSLVLYVIAAVAVYRIVLALPGGDRRLALIAGLAVATSPGFADGAAFLLETPLFVLLGVVLAGALARGRLPVGPAGNVLLGVGLAALALARPEGLVLALLLAATHLAITRDAPLANRVLPLALFSALMSGYYLWRLRTFGTWAPNTYYAKTSATRWYEIRDGFVYALRFTLGPGAPAMLLTIAAPLLALAATWRDRAARLRTIALCGLAGAGAGVVVWAGGDCYGGGRFLALPVTLAMLATACVAAGTEGSARRIARAALGATLALQLALMVVVPIYLAVAEPAALRKHLRANMPLRAASFDCDREASAKLSAFVGTGVVAQTDYQRLKYFADELHVIDLTGLNDRRIAHRRVDGPVLWGKFDLDDTLALRPDVFIWGHHVEPHPQPMARVSLKQLLGTPSLAEESFGFGVAPVYVAPLTAVFRTASLPVCGGWFHFMVRKDRAADLVHAGGVVGPDEP